MSAWLSGFLVLAALVSVAALLHAWQGRSAAHPEVVRKLFHLAAGVVSLTFPFLFRDTWAMVGLTAAMVGSLVVVRRTAALRLRIGQVVHGVERHSLGDVCFPVGVCLLFVLSAGDPLLYMVPLLVLTFADPAAALVGTRWGVHRYHLFGARKSLEGSFAFFLVAAATCALGPLVAGRALSGELIGAMTAVAAGLTVVEAVSGRGIDNLSIPLAAIALLGGLHVA